MRRASRRRDVSSIAKRYVCFRRLARHFPRANPPSGGANDSSVVVTVDSSRVFRVSAEDGAGVRTSNSGASTCRARYSLTDPRPTRVNTDRCKLPIPRLPTTTRSARLLATYAVMVSATSPPPAPCPAGSTSTETAATPTFFASSAYRRVASSHRRRSRRSAWTRSLRSVSVCDGRSEGSRRECEERTVGASRRSRRGEGGVECRCVRRRRRERTRAYHGPVHERTGVGGVLRRLLVDARERARVVRPRDVIEAVAHGRLATQRGKRDGRGERSQLRRLVREVLPVLRGVDGEDDLPPGAPARRHLRTLRDGERVERRTHRVPTLHGARGGECAAVEAPATSGVPKNSRRSGMVRPIDRDSSAVTGRGDHGSAAGFANPETTR